MRKNQELALRAAELSNFDGEEIQSADYMSAMLGNELAMYKGIQNPFKGSLERIAAKNGNRVFKLEIINANESDEEFFLNPSYLIDATQDGHPLSGRSTTGKDLIFKGSPGINATQALRNLYAYILQNPLVLMAMRLSSTKEEQMQESFQIGYLDPFKAQTEVRELFISSYTDENTQQNKRATINEALPFDNQTQIVMPIKAGSTLSITMFFGPTINQAQLLRLAAQEALK